MGKAQGKTSSASRTSPQRTEAPSHLPLNIKGWQVLLILAALTAIFFREILLGTSFFWEDFLYQNYPFRNFAATSMAAGEIPLWNPFTLNGMPFLADIQTTVFYLPSLILTLFVRDGHLNFYWLELMVILHFLLAGVSMYALARSYSLHRIPALFAGAAYMLSGFMVAHAIHQQITTLAAWYPLLLFLARKVLHESRMTWVFLTGAVLGHSILAGFPQLTLYFYLFLFAYLLFELLTTFPGMKIFSRPALGTAGRATLVILISVAIAAVQLLPTLELSPLSQRAEITYEKSTEGSLGWGQMLTFLYPKFFGTSTPQEYQYWGPGPYWHYWETCVYLGILPLFLGILSLTLLRRNRHIAFFAGVALFALVFALGKNAFLHSFFFHFIPGFALFRNPARMGILLAFCFALLSGFALENLLHQERSAALLRLQRSLLLGALGLGLLVWFLTVSGSLTGAFPFLRDMKIFSMIRESANTQLPIIVLSAAMVYTLVVNHWKLTLAGPLLILVFLGDITLFGSKQIASPLSPAVYFSRTSPITSFLRAEGKNEIFRVNTRTSHSMILDRNQGMIDRIFMMEGYTPLALQRLYPPVGSIDQMYDLLNVKYKTVDERGAPSLVLHPTYLPRAFFVHAMHIVRSEPELFEYLKSPVFDPRTIAVLEDDPGFSLPPSSAPPQDRVSVTRYSNNAIVLDAATAQDGLLVLSEMYYPGWNAFVDGQQTVIHRADYNLRCFFVSAGSHRIEVLYQPESFQQGTLITLFCLTLCGVGSVISLMRSRKTRTSGQGATS
jgi:Bacterial membrane protein YfhO